MLTFASTEGLFLGYALSTPHTQQSVTQINYYIAGKVYLWSGARDFTGSTQNKNLELQS